MYLLSDEAFAEAMSAYTRHGLTAAGPHPGVLPDDPDALAAEGGGDDPDACADHVGDDAETAPDPADRPPAGQRTAGTWRATWLAEVFRAEGLVVVEVEGWKTRGVAFPDTPAEEGVSLFHHTASSASSGPAGGLRVVTYGRPGLAGPICNWLTARNGVIYVVAAGVANHAGRGNARVAGLPNTTGNANALGDEMENDGRGEKFSPVQYTAAIKSHAAVHRKLGWPATRGIGHKEWSTSGKPDPLLHMGQVRNDLAAAIRRGVTPDEDEDMTPEQFVALLRHKDVRAVMGEVVKEARFGFSSTPDGKGYSVGGALLTLLQRTTPPPAPKKTGPAEPGQDDQIRTGAQNPAGHGDAEHTTTDWEQHRGREHTAEAGDQTGL